MWLYLGYGIELDSPLSSFFDHVLVSKLKILNIFSSSFGPYPPKRTILFFINTEECNSKLGKSSPSLNSAPIYNIGEL